MKRRRFIVVAILAIFVGILAWLLFKPNGVKHPMNLESKPTPATSTATKATPPVTPGATAAAKAAMDARRKATVEKVLAVLATPITFYGKVVDQNGNPVPGATVNYNALDKFDEPGSQYHGVSDSDGNFTISGIGGAVLNVGVRKNGYYMIDGKSAASFAYGVGPDANRQSPPSKSTPAIFVLQKMGSAEPLIVVGSRTYRIAKTGQPVAVDLRTGRPSPQGNFRVEAWTQDQNPDEKQHYDWRCRVSVPNGGLVERKDPFAFEAPLGGYKPSDEIVVTRTAEEWQSQAKRDYFLKFPDGCYARVQFKMIAGGDHFFRLESYLNPEAGSRNLEFDPKQRVSKP